MMITKYYVGKPLLGLGVPYAIISVEEINNMFWCESLLILLGNRNTYHRTTMRVFKFDEQTIEQFIEASRFAAEGIILFNIIENKFPNWKNTLQQFVELKEVNSNNLLFLLTLKNRDLLNKLSQTTANSSLKEKIQLYTRIVINQEVDEEAELDNGKHE